MNSSDSMVLKLKEYGIEKGERIVQEKRLYKHQEQVLQSIEEAIDNKKKKIIINISPTGAGKTLSAYSPLLTRDKLRAIGIYPTNQLIEDQIYSLKLLNLKCEMVFSEKIDEWEEKLETNDRSHIIESIFEYPYIDVVLTNPDIIYYICFGQYHTQHGRNRFIARVLSAFNLWVFDEFHLYDQKQKAELISIIFAAFNSHNKDQIPCFVILTATFDKKDFEIFNIFKQFGIEIDIIEAKEGDVIIQEKIEVNIIPSNLYQWNGIDTLYSKFEDEILEVYKKYPTLIILDSVAQASEYATHLIKKELDVAQVHGLKKDFEALKKHIVVGTSSIEVGIDPKEENGTYKSAIVFEARTYEQAIQRLGRIGRGKNLDRVSYAYMLVPQYVFDKIHQNLNYNNELERQQFFDYLKDSYIEIETFNEVKERVAALTIFYALKILKEINATISQNIFKFFSLLTGQTFKFVQQEYEDMSNCFSQIPYFEEILFSFRDYTPSLCLIVDNDVIFVDLISGLKHFILKKELNEDNLIEYLQENFNEKEVNKIKRKIKRNKSCIGIYAADKIINEHKGVSFFFYEADVDFDEIYYEGLRFIPLKTGIKDKQNVFKNYNNLRRINKKLEKFPILSFIISNAEFVRFLKMRRKIRPPLLRFFNYYENPSYANISKDADIIFLGRNALIAWSSLHERGVEIL